MPLSLFFFRGPLLNDPVQSELHEFDSSAVAYSTWGHAWAGGGRAPWAWYSQQFWRYSLSQFTIPQVQRRQMLWILWQNAFLSLRILNIILIKNVGLVITFYHIHFVSSTWQINFSVTECYSASSTFWGLITFLNPMKHIISL